jgi:hypothetical protein
MSHTIKNPQTEKSRNQWICAGQVTGEVLHVDAARVEKW